MKPGWLSTKHYEMLHKTHVIVFSTLFETSLLFSMLIYSFLFEPSSIVFNYSSISPNYFPFFLFPFFFISIFSDLLLLLLFPIFLLSFFFPLIFVFLHLFFFLCSQFFCSHIYFCFDEFFFFIYLWCDNILGPKGQFISGCRNRTKEHFIGGYWLTWLWKTSFVQRGKRWVSDCRRNNNMIKIIRIIRMRIVVRMTYSRL